MKMVSRFCRISLFILASLYVLIFLIYSNALLFQKCLFRNTSKGTIFQFNVRLKGNSEQMFDVSNKNQQQSKEIEITAIKDDVKRKEALVISKQEYKNGVIQLDTTEIKETKTERNYKNYNHVTINKTRSDKRYIFSLRYYEQLSMATNNMLTLASLATHNNRHVVMPFVNNSRFSGLRLGVSMSRFKEATRNNQTNLNKYSDLSTYFDVHHLNNVLADRGYNTLAPFKDFQRDCVKMDIVIHFLYKDEADAKDFVKWYKTPSHRYKDITQKARKNNGWTDCNFVKRSRISTFLGNIGVDQYVCVDPEMIKTAEELERIVLKNAQCVGVVLWKGFGKKRTHFPLPMTITNPLKPSDLRHNRRLIDIAYTYIRNTIKRPFISVHVRSERHIIWKGLQAAKRCISKLSKKVKERKTEFSLKKVFVASDLGKDGSGTLLSHSTTDERDLLLKQLTETFHNPYTFNPKDYNLYDRGEIAIVEMHILSMGESLFTLGRGNFQQWIIDLFLLHNAEDTSLVYKICELGKDRTKRS